jgi:poly(A) polymerase
MSCEATEDYLSSAEENAMARLTGTQYQRALAIVERLRLLGHAAFFAGGCVRDLLLGLEAKDFDVATSARPEEILAAFPRTESVGAHFGVVLVLDGHGDERIATEVATFRYDGAYTDGRRPDAVRFSTDPREDVLRRDFTINGMLLDVRRWEAGDALEDCVLDSVGGLSDLAAGVVRAIGEPARRFAEDKLRMLRAVRFAARLGFAMEPKTMRAIQHEAAEIHAVSAERARDELTKILTEGEARRGFESLDECGLLRELLPEVAKMKGVEQPPEFHPEGDVWVHTLMLLAHLPAGASATLAWGMLLHDVGKPATFTAPDAAKPGDRIRFNGHVEVGIAVTRGILKRLRFSNDDSAQVLALIQHHMRFGDVMKMKQSTLKRFLRLPLFDEHLALHFADVSSSHGKLALYDFAKQKLAAMGAEGVKPKLLVTGADLIAAGYRAGPLFKPMLEAAEDAQLEGVFHTTEEGVLWLRQHFGSRV